MRTKTLFLDEQEGTVGGEKFTAVVGFRVNAEDLHEIRKIFYPIYNKIIDRHLRGPDAEGNFIHLLPPLHGRAFLTDEAIKGFFDKPCPDEVKINVLDALCETLSGFDVDFIRIGYFDRSFPKELGPQTRDEIINLGVLGCSFAYCHKTEDQTVFVSEVDKEALRKNLDKVLSPTSHLYAFSPDNVSFDVSKFVGHFYAPKSELGCQITDIVGYLALKHQTPTSSGAAILSERFKLFEQKYFFNRLIWINDPSRNVCLHEQAQNWPADELKERRPIQGVAKIIPNDGPLLTEPPIVVQ